MPSECESCKWWIGWAGETTDFGKYAPCVKSDGPHFLKVTHITHGCDKYEAAAPTVPTPTPAGHDVVERISHEQARESAQRLVNSHFRQEPHARVSIPARPDHDDDLIIMAYIDQQAALASVSAPPGLVLVPREPTEAALEMVIPEPTHLYRGRDQDFINMMKAATAIDRLTAASHYRTLVDAMTMQPAEGG